jgi:2-polyprenyl-6-methoxyphenol hydroxylase-like FAD-dependent oxidoreductase
VELHRRTEVLGLDRAPDGRVTGVATRGPSGERHLDAGIVVGADGIRSTVARAVGAQTLRRGRAAGGVLYRYVRGLDVTGYEWFYGDRAAAGLIPTNDEATCVFVSATSARLRRERAAGTEQAFVTLLDASAPGLAAAVVADTTDRSRMHGWRGTVGQRFQHGRASGSIAGARHDAAYVVDRIERSDAATCMSPKGAS